MEILGSKESRNSTSHQSRLATLVYYVQNGQLDISAHVRSNISLKYHSFILIDSLQ